MSGINEKVIHHDGMSTVDVHTTEQVNDIITSTVGNINQSGEEF